MVQCLFTSRCCHFLLFSFKILNPDILLSRFMDGMTITRENKATIARCKVSECTAKRRKKRVLVTKTMSMATMCIKMLKSRQLMKINRVWLSLQHTHSINYEYCTQRTCWTTQLNGPGPGQCGSDYCDCDCDWMLNSNNWTISQWDCFNWNPFEWHR